MNDFSFLIVRLIPVKFQGRQRRRGLKIGSWYSRCVQANFRAAQKADCLSAGSQELQRKRLSWQGYFWWNFCSSSEETLSFKKWCTNGRLCKILIKNQLKEFPWKRCCFRRQPGKPDFFLALADWTVYSQTDKCVKVHVITTGNRGKIGRPVTKKLTQNHLFEGAIMCCRSFSTFQFAWGWRMKVAFVMKTSGKLV